MRDAVIMGGPHCLLLIVLLGYGVIQVRSFAPAYAEVDPDGYVWMAKHFARGELPLTEQPDEFSFHSHVWVENQSGLVTAKFAPGYPILLAMAYRLGGDTAVFWVSPLMGGLALVGAFLLFRLWMPILPAVLAVFAMAAGRMYLYYSGFLLTHVANLCCVTWGAYFLWKWYRDPRHRWAVPAGLLIGYAPLIRHTSVLMGLVAATALIARSVKDWRDDSFRWRETVSLVLAGAVFPVLLLVYNKVVFGGFWITGYQLSNEQTAFSFQYFWENYDLLARGLYEDALPVISPLGVIGVLTVGKWPERCMRLLWLVPLYLVYSAYYWAVPGQAYYRFMIMTIPVMAGAAFALISNLPRKHGRYIGSWAVCGLVLLFQGNAVYKGLKGKLSGRNRQKLAAVCQQLTDQLDDDAVIFTRYPLHFHLGVRADFQVYNLGAFREQYVKESFQQNKDSTPRRQPLRTKMFKEFYEKLDQEGLNEELSRLVSDYIAAGRQVVFVMSPNRETRYANVLDEGCKLKKHGGVSFEWQHWRRKRKIQRTIYVVDCATDDDKKKE